MGTWTDEHSYQPTPPPSPETRKPKRGVVVAIKEARTAGYSYRVIAAVSRVILARRLRKIVKFPVPEEETVMYAALQRGKNNG